jgi:hypothetical protein
MSSLLTTASWVIVNKETQAAVLETFNQSVANTINKKKYRAVPILEYLQTLNDNIKESTK